MGWFGFYTQRNQQANKQHNFGHIVYIGLIIIDFKMFLTINRIIGEFNFKSV